MKKILILLLVLSLMTFCACRNSVIDDLPDDVKDPGNVTDPADPTPSDKIDWETPIDIDDAFQEEIEIDTTDADITEPSDENEPTSGETTAAQNNPTQPNVSPTEPTPTQPTPTEPVETTRPVGSGPIELPMIPG